jgi:hypothetical protein
MALVAYAYLRYCLYRSIPLIVINFISLYMQVIHIIFINNFFMHLWQSISVIFFCFQFYIILVSHVIIQNKYVFMYNVVYKRMFKYNYFLILLQNFILKFV